MKRILIKPGGVFEVKLNSNNKRYFQYITKDTTQLNSQVVAVFKRSYEIKYNPVTSEITSDDIDFYAHTMIRGGLFHKLWDPAGKGAILDRDEKIMFRHTEDYGFVKKEISDRWYIWEINNKPIEVGKLDSKTSLYNVGLVINPFGLFHKIKTDNYKFSYPK